MEYNPWYWVDLSMKCACAQFVGHILIQMTKSFICWLGEVGGAFNLREGGGLEYLHGINHLFQEVFYINM